MFRNGADVTMSDADMGRWIIDLDRRMTEIERQVGALEQAGEPEQEPTVFDLDRFMNGPDQGSRRLYHHDPANRRPSSGRPEQEQEQEQAGHGSRERSRTVAIGLLGEQIPEIIFETVDALMENRACNWDAVLAGKGADPHKLKHFLRWHGLKCLQALVYVTALEHGGVPAGALGVSFHAWSALSQVVWGIEGDKAVDWGRVKEQVTPPWAEYQEEG